MKTTKLNLSILLILTTLTLVATTLMTSGYDKKAKEQLFIFQNILGNRG
tara:strand:+ start:91 stop:237 length:147 start_codon:yes stop_codon:yes gene_type:complete